MNELFGTYARESESDRGRCRFSVPLRRERAFALHHLTGAVSLIRQIGRYSWQQIFRRILPAPISPSFAPLFIEPELLSRIRHAAC